MHNNSLFNLIQMATGIALVIGLVLVFVELQQAKSLSLAELTSEGYSEAMAEFRAVMGENPAPIIAKSCHDPEALNAEEYIVLTAFYSSKIAQITRLRVLEAVADFGVPWQTVARQQLVGILETEPGKAWFLRHFEVDPELYAIADEMIAAGISCDNPVLPPGPESNFGTD